MSARWSNQDWLVLLICVTVIVCATVFVLLGSLPGWFWQV